MAYGFKDPASPFHSFNHCSLVATKLIKELENES
jgi:hypothetical protein